jgi:hypothetical protein
MAAFSFLQILSKTFGKTSRFFLSDFLKGRFTGQNYLLAGAVAEKWVDVPE